MNLLQIMLITSMQVLASIRWVDEADKNGPINMDIFFDRVVIIAGKLKPVKPSLPANLNDKGYLEKGIIAPGVFLSNNHVLTSYNPFRYILQKNSNIQYLSVKVLLKRKIEEPHQHVYETETATLKCARQIMPIAKEKLNMKQWHGLNKTHSPVHDLMVLQLNKNVVFIEQKIHSFNSYPAKSFRLAGPLLTRYATKGDILGNSVKFASLGFQSKRHINKTSKLASRTYEEDEAILEDCEKWMPRYWGHFICIRNVDNYKGVGSGAILIHKETLYGVGSFSLNKGNESILVFTDVRPYTHLFFKGCP